MSKIFVQDATLLDCALLLPEIGPVGRSYAVDVLWEGETDSQGMVFDFAIAKRVAKQTIDQEFDHKILVKSSQIRYQDHDKVIVADSYVDPSEEKHLAFFALNTYSQGVKKISRETMKSFQSGDLSLLEKDMGQDILRHSPANVKNVHVTLRPHSFSQIPQGYSYTHNLCHHVGNCQRFHGHSSVLEIYKNGQLDVNVSHELAKKLNQKHIVSKSYVKDNWDHILFQEILQYCPEIEENKEHLILLQHEGTQGVVATVLPKSAVVCLNRESTVENIAHYLYDLLGCDEGIEVRTFEGLCKGAIYP